MVHVKQKIVSGFQKCGEMVVGDMGVIQSEYRDAKTRGVVSIRGTHDTLLDEYNVVLWTEAPDYLEEIVDTFSLSLSE